MAATTTTTTYQPPTSPTHLHDIPDVILSNILASIQDTRTRNSFSLVCTKWLLLDRSTRTSLTLRGNFRGTFMVPSCFRSITYLDLSLLSPWGHSLFPDSSSQDSLLLSQFLRIAFPCVTSLVLYSRTPSTLQFLSPQWPNLRHIKLIRWHQRCQSPIGSDFFDLFENCTSLTSLDLSHFYCWTEDLPVALESYSSIATSLTYLNLLTVPSPEGFKSQELITISTACPNLRDFLVACMFDPRYIDFIGDEALGALASNCPKLVNLHLADTSSLSNKRGDPDDEGYTSEDAKISLATLEELFKGLPLLEELVLDVCHNVRDSGVMLEVLNNKCPRLKSLKLGQFHGICRPGDSKIEGVAVCKGLEMLTIKNSADLTDSNLMVIALGCPRLANMGMPLNSGQMDSDFDLNELDYGAGVSSEMYESDDLCFPTATKWNADCYDTRKNKKCKYSSHSQSNGNGISDKSWDQLQYLSLWFAVGDLLSTLPLYGLEICPVLEEIQIKVEGDCRSRPPRPNDQSFGLICLARYPQLSKMKLDCGDALGYSLTAPSGQMDLSPWERFYLMGISHLNLNELDYWPPQDKDVNQRCLSLPAVGLLSECVTLKETFRPWNCT
ncbi:F-box/LRR-repeat MAX2-like protein [Thalictrum thalictroides]|uniref:F-box/LRR-repeat MAX2-like protein n=1 Tax=Thalictrum thalictroides TaxID=46969 RepID=A0A7J6XA21_THATH|nr:F-box/LRR-repeat MAX2-like protein [Thalictrum thalictroides]